MSPATSGIRAGAAYVELFLNDSRLTKGLKGAQKRLAAWGSAVSGFGRQLLTMGTAAVGGLLGMVKAAASMGSELVETSARTGMAVEAIQELDYAARQAGVSAEQFETGLGKMQKAIGTAEIGGGEALETFVRLGVSLGQLKTMTPDKQFETIAEAISKVPDPAKRAAFAMQLFGRGGLSMLPLMMKGAGGIEALRKKAQELGLVMSGEAAQAAKEFQDKLATLWSSVKMGVFNIGSALMPALSGLIDRVMSALKIAGDWVKANGGLIVSIAKIAAAVVAAGAGLIVLGSLFSAAAAVIGGVLGAMSAVGTVIGVVGTIIGAVLSPIGLAVAAVAGLGAKFLVMSGGVADAIEVLKPAFASLSATATAAFGAIRDALASGDFALAAKVAWASLKLVFATGTAALSAAWIDFKTFFQRTWTEAVYGAAKLFTGAWAGVQKAFSEATGFLSDTWTIFTTGLVKAWNTCIGFIKKAWLRLKGLFDADINVNAGVDAIDQDVAGQNKDASDVRDKTLIKSDDARKNRNQQIDADEQGALGQLDKDNKHTQAAINGSQNAQIAALQKELDDNKAELGRLVAQANGQGRDNPWSKGGVGADKLDNAAVETIGLAKASGTFSSIGAAMIGSGGAPMEQVVRNTAKIAKDARTTAINTAKRPRMLAGNH